MIAVGYIRRSKKSDQKTISLDDQREQITACCKKLNLVCAEIVMHDGISGSRRDRFEEINNALRRTLADHLVIYHLDRLARDAAGLMDYLASIAARNIRVIEVGGVGEVHSTKAIDKLQTGMRGMVDEFYRNIVREKTKAALAHLRGTDRRWTRIPPMGYAWHEQKLVENPDEQRALAVILECAILGISARKTFAEVRKTGYQGRLNRQTVSEVIGRVRKVGPNPHGIGQI